MHGQFHVIRNDSGRFPNAGDRVTFESIDTDMIKRIAPGSTGNSKLILHFGGGLDLCESVAEASFWAQDPKQLQGASAAVNLVDPSVLALEYATTDLDSKADARAAAAASYFTRITTAISSGFIALPAPAAWKVVTITNAGANATTVCTNVNTVKLDGVADGDEALAVGAKKSFYCKADPALGWFTLS